MRRLWPVLAGWLAICASPLPGGAVETAGDRDAEPRATASPDTLACVLADWTVQALGQRAGGLAVWVDGPGGELRVDLMADAPPVDADRASLLSRSGRGWTLVAGADGEGIYGAWDREWRAAPAGLADLARAVAAQAGTGQGGHRSRHLTLAEPVEPGDPAAPSGPQSGFRHRLTRRGRGAGGPGERIVVGAADALGRVRVRSSRRPGALTVSPRERRPAAGQAAEVFLPWWSLDEVLVWPAAANPGTSDARPR